MLTHIKSNSSHNMHPIVYSFIRLFFYFLSYHQSFNHKTKQFFSQHAFNRIQVHSFLLFLYLGHAAIRYNLKRTWSFITHCFLYHITRAILAKRSLGFFAQIPMHYIFVTICSFLTYLFINLVHITTKIPSSKGFYISFKTSNINLFFYFFYRSIQKHSYTFLTTFC